MQVLVTRLGRTGCGHANWLRTGWGLRVFLVIAGSRGPSSESASPGSLDAARGTEGCEREPSDRQQQQRRRQTKSEAKAKW